MKLDAAKTVLLVVDMQNDFYGSGGNADRRGKPVSQMRSLPGRINNFAAVARKAGVLVVFTKFLYDPERSPRNYTELIGDVKSGNWMCKAGSPGAELQGVRPGGDDIVMEKYSNDCFGGTQLKQLLSDSGIENVVLTGVRTEICIMATAIRSFTEGYRTYVASDLVGTYDDKPAIAGAVLEALRYSAYIVPSSELTFAAG